MPDARRGRLRAAARVHGREDPQPARVSAGGRGMTGSSTRPNEGGLFARELLTRGRATRTARPGLPGAVRSLDADPAKTVPGLVAGRPWPVGSRVTSSSRSRTVYLDSDSAARQPRADPRRDARPDRVPARFGVAIHEMLHAKHTKRWAIEREIELSDRRDPHDRQLAVDRRLLEEPRMEATGVREFPPPRSAAGSSAARSHGRGRRAAARFTEAICSTRPPPGTVATRELAAARSCTCRRAPTTGSRPGTVLEPLPGYGGRCSASRDLDSLDELFARVIWIGDGDLDALDRYASDYRTIIGPATRPRLPSAAHNQVGARAMAPGDGAQARAASTAPTKASRQRRSRSATPSSRPPAGGRRAARAAGRGRRPPTSARAGRDPASRRLERAARYRSSEGRLPDRGVDRPPSPTRCSSPATTPGAFTRHSPTGTSGSTSATRPAGSTPAPTPRARHRDAGAAGQPPPVARSRPGTRPAAGATRRDGDRHLRLNGLLRVRARTDRWVLTNGLRQFGGRCAISLFGNSAALLCDGSRPLPLVPGIRTGGGTAFAGDAIGLSQSNSSSTTPAGPGSSTCLRRRVVRHRAGRRPDPELREHEIPTSTSSIGIAAAVGRVRPRSRSTTPRRRSTYRRRHGRGAAGPRASADTPSIQVKEPGFMHNPTTKTTRGRRRLVRAAKDGGTGR